MPKIIAGERVERELASPEGTLYFTSRHIYKVFSQTVNIYEALLHYQSVVDSGLPVPGAVKFNASLQDGATASPIEGLRFAKVFGRFFQIGKPGNEQLLVNEIKSATNMALLKTLIAGLTRAAELGVADPQGFLCTSASPPISFIDAHFGGGANPAAFNMLINTAKAKLAQLEQINAARESEVQEAPEAPSASA